MKYFTQKEDLIVEERKVKEYLLNVGHPDGGGKARYFISLGYTLDNWEVFSEALKSHATQAEITQILSTEFGLKFILDGSLGTLGKENVFVRSVWVVNKQDNFPILVTVYPLKKDDKRI